MPKLIAFPPVVYLVCFVIGIVLDLIQPMAPLSDAVQYPIGGFLIVVSFIPVPFILTRFLRPVAE